MSSLYILIKDTDELLKKDLKALIVDEAKESVSSAMFDSIEFFCNFLETAYESEFEIEELDDLCSMLESNINLVGEFFSDGKKLDLVKVDVPLRLAIIKCDEINETKSKKFLDDLDEILKSEEEVSIRYEALQLRRR